MFKQLDILKVGLVLLTLGIACSFLHAYPETWPAFTLISEFYANTSTELISIAITVLIIDRIYENKQEIQNKKRLVWEMGSTDRAFAARATKELRDNGSLLNGGLNDIDLELASLEGANLEGAVLKRANLMNANLKNASLRNADLSEAKLDGGALYEAQLDNAVLTGARLPRARLQKATLEHINLSGGVDLLGASFAAAVLRNADLSDSQLEEVDFRNADLTCANLSSATLLRADLDGVVLRNARMDRADLSEVKNWEKIRDISEARISGIRNPPQGFHDWAINNGAKE